MATPSSRMFLTAAGDSDAQRETVVAVGDTINIFVLLTVTDVAQRHTEHTAAFPWQQQLRERAAMLRCT